jgi:hypothetical protein
MPYLHLDLPGAYAVEVKRELATRLCTLYADVMETQLWRPNVGIAADIKRFVNAASHPTADALAAEAAAFAAAVARPATPAIIEQALEQGFQQRSDVELNLGAYVGKVVHKPGTVTPACAVGAEAQKIEEPSSQSDRL